MHSGGRDPLSNWFCNEMSSLVKIKFKCREFLLAALRSVSFTFINVQQTEVRKGCNSSREEEKIPRDFLSARYSQTYGIHASRLHVEVNHGWCQASQPGHF